MDVIKRLLNNAWKFISSLTEKIIPALSPLLKKASRLAAPLRKKASHYHEVMEYHFPWLLTRKALVAAGVVAALIIGIVVINKVFFPEKKAVEGPDMVQVKTQKIRRENFVDTYMVMGTIKGAIENEMRFEIDGVISSYNYKEGDRLQKGQTVCSLDPKDAFTKADFARSKFSSEQSAYYSASQRLKVYEDLYRMKAVSESKFKEMQYETASAEARMKAARSELELAQSNLAKTNLLAPSEGTLAEVIIKSGDYVTPQDVVAKFISGGQTNFEVDVPEKDVNKLKTGLRVKINCDSYQNRDFYGTISEIAPTVKERTRTTTIKISVENNEGTLRSGMFGRGLVYLMEVPNAIIIPSDSIVSLGDATFLVPLVKPDPRIPGEGTVEMRTIKPGMKLSQKTIIDDGLFPDEQVIIETQGQLSDGIRVKFTEAEPDKNNPQNINLEGSAPTSEEGGEASGNSQQ